VHRGCHAKATSSALEGKAFFYFMTGQSLGISGFHFEVVFIRGRYLILPFYMPAIEKGEGGCDA
jgi:hypothetical protein